MKTNRLIQHFLSICLVSLFYLIIIIGGYQKASNFGDFLFIFYAIQVTVVSIGIGMSLFDGYISKKELHILFIITYVNIVIYSITAVLMGTFYLYVEDMASYLADMLNSVFLVCAFFWVRNRLS